MPAVPEQKPDRKILSELEIKAACSDFIRLFLIKEAKMLHRHLNSHINHILKLYFQGKISKIKRLKLAKKFINNILSVQKASITIHPYKSVLKLIPAVDLAEITQAIETAIYCYVIAVLNNPDEQNKAAKEIGKEILKHLTEWEINNKNDTA